MKEESCLRIKDFFQQERNLERYLIEPRNCYNKVQRVTRSILNIRPTDLVVKVCGLEDCSPNKLPVSGQKVLYSLHFILRGEGTFSLVNQEDFRLTEGCFFCSMKDIENTYYPKPNNPWSYIFVGVSGVLADSLIKYLGLDSYNCVIPSAKAKGLKECFFEIHKAFNQEGQASLQVMAALYKLFAELEKICCPPKKYVDDTEHHIHNALENIRNCGYGATAEVVAKNCGLNRIYLSRIMKERVGLTLQDMIIATRLWGAMEYLKFGDKKMSIAEVAKLVGYTDVKYFSKLFKKVFGITPSEYRERVDEGTLN